MEPSLALLFGAIFVNNVVLVQFLGLCPFMGTSGQLKNALGMGLASAFVLTLAATLSFLVYQLVLQPLHAEGLRTVAFIVIIAGVVQFTEMYLRSQSPLLYATLGIYLPLITTNCAVLGVALLAVRKYTSLLEIVIFSFGSALGFSLALLLFSLLRERIESADVPAPFRGAPIAMITAGIMSLAFMGFAGFDFTGRG